MLNRSVWLFGTFEVFWNDRSVLQGRSRLRFGTWNTSQPTDLANARPGLPLSVAACLRNRSIENNGLSQINATRIYPFQHAMPQCHVGSAISGVSCSCRISDISGSVPYVHDLSGLSLS